MAAEQKTGKLVVLIPTRDRPAYLNVTVESVLEQAKRFGHKDVEIVVSDVSESKNAKQNEKFVERLRARFPNTPVHYYGPGEPEAIKRLLEKATDEERRAYEKLAPADGHYGAHRNRLALLGVYHGGENAAYLHLDDDTPLLDADKEGRVAKKPGDALGAFRKGLETALDKDKLGFSGAISGVEDARVSFHRSIEPGSLRKILSKPSLLKPIVFAPGRVLEERAMRVPYGPYGVNEDSSHYERVARRYNRLVLVGNAYASSAAPETMILHIGVAGPVPKDRNIMHSLMVAQALADGYAAPWERLVNRMAELGRRRERRE